MNTLIVLNLSARSVSLRAGLRQSGKKSFLKFSARLKSCPDTCVAVVTHCDQGRIKLSPLNPAGEGRAFGVAAYGAPLLLLKSTQGLRAWARLFRASGAGTSLVLQFRVLKIANRKNVDRFFNDYWRDWGEIRPGGLRI
jgi:hypothetical protein